MSEPTANTPRLYQAELSTDLDYGTTMLGTEMRMIECREEKAHRSLFRFIRRWFHAVPKSPREIAFTASQMIYHFIGTGALAGVNQKLDPDIVPEHAVSMCAAGAILLALMFAPSLVKLGLLLVIFSPLWLYAIPQIPDPVMENRAYLTLPGIALIAAYAATVQPPLVLCIAGLYACLTFERNQCWSSGFLFWKRASQESPAHLRARVNYAVALSKREEYEETIRVYQEILETGDTSREVGLAAANLALQYVHQNRLSNDPRWIEGAARVLEYGVTHWPDHPRIRYTRGCMFMSFAEPLPDGEERQQILREAVAEYTFALDLQPYMVEALRFRARCHGLMGDWRSAKADSEAAQKLDGIPTVMQFIDPDKEAIYREESL